MTARTQSTKPPTAGFLALAIWATPSIASAHLVSSGMGAFYDGVAHFLVSPEDLVVVVALALFGGLSGRKSARSLVASLPLAWLIGAGLGVAVDASLPAILPSFGILAVGLLVALNPKVPSLLPPGIAFGLGLLHGFLNGRDMTLSSAPLPTAVGVATALAVLCLLVSALAVSLHLHWQRIAARAVGSWIAAIGILMIAWTFRPQS